MTMPDNVIPMHGDGESPDYRRGTSRGQSRTGGQQWHARQANARKERDQLRELAKTVPCPPPPQGCGKPVGDACVDVKTQHPLKHFPGHPARINNARKANR